MENGAAAWPFPNRLEVGGAPDGWGPPVSGKGGAGALLGRGARLGRCAAAGLGHVGWGWAAACWPTRACGGGEGAGPRGEGREGSRPKEEGRSFLSFFINRFLFLSLLQN